MFLFLYMIIEYIAKSYTKSKIILRVVMLWRKGSMNVIEINHITKDYGQNKGVFDLDFKIEEGEVVGFLGPNGSGKTTTIRQLMGFIQPDKGSMSILGMDCFQDAPAIQEKVGYLPGEIAFMEDMTGIEFIRFIGELKGIKDFKKAQELIDFLELDPHGKIKRMSKGMKQKIALVVAFMQDTPILILDEPTSGLDPLMQLNFQELIQQAKKDKKTILMSSHIFEEIENLCDRVVFIRQGCIVSIEDMQHLKNSRFKYYDIVFHNHKDAKDFCQNHLEASLHDLRVSLSVQGQADQLIKELSKYTIDDLNIRRQSLEEIFLQYYGGNK